MKLYLRNATRGFHIDSLRIRKHLRVLLSAINESGSSLSLSYIRDVEMAQINYEHRGKDQTTDVLSFPLDGGTDKVQGVERILGDIVISLDVALRQAVVYGADINAEVERLLLHGLLHLIGHDHEEPEERATMEAEERRLADTIGLPWPYLHGER